MRRRSRRRRGLHGSTRGDGATGRVEEPVEAGEHEHRLVDERVAIAHAIDRKFVVETIFLGYAAASTGPVPNNWRPYLEKLPNDPWGRPYQFLSPGIKGEVDVMSFGADGQSGGEGKNADIGSWQ